jgi:hypothetical protein
MWRTARSGEAQDSLKQLKRKSAQAFDGDGEDEAMDRQFLEADRIILEGLRADELPAHTRSTVLNATSTVRTRPLRRNRSPFAVFSLLIC